MVENLDMITHGLYRKVSVKSYGAGNGPLTARGKPGVELFVLLVAVMIQPAFYTMDIRGMHTAFLIFMISLTAKSIYQTRASVI